MLLISAFLVTRLLKLTGFALSREGLAALSCRKQHNLIRLEDDMEVSIGNPSVDCFQSAKHEALVGLHSLPGRFLLAVFDASILFKVPDRGSVNPSPLGDG